MVKFFKREPKKCYMCGIIFDDDIKIRQSLRVGIGMKHFCSECFNKVQSQVEPEVNKFFDKAKKSDKKIDLSQARSLAQEITKKITKK